MGEGTQEVLKLSCRGCGTSFRLTPRKDRLPRNPIPCPKCGSNIEYDEAAAASATGKGDALPASDGDVTRIPGLTDGDTARVPALRRRSDSSGGDSEESEGNHTLVGAPVSVDPIRGFSRASHATRVGSSSRLRSLSKAGRGMAGLGEDRSPDSREFDQIGGPEVGDGDDSPGLRRQKSLRPQVTTAQQPAVSGSDAFGADAPESDVADDDLSADATRESKPGSNPWGRAGGAAGESPDKTRLVKATGKPALADLLKKVREKRGPDADAPSSSPPSLSPPSLSPPSISPPSISPPRPPRADDDDDDSLFDEIAKAVGESAEVRLAESADAPADRSHAKTVERIVRLDDQTLERALLPEEKALKQGLREDQSRDETVEVGLGASSSSNSSKHKKPGDASTPGAGILSRPDSPRARADDDERGATPSSTTRPAQRPEAAILGRIRTLKRPATEVLGTASERGDDSAAAAIRKVVGSGDYRLRVDGEIYAPLERAGLVTLVEAGVLHGAEEIAEADGPWAPISQHPVFRELRRSMADQAHQILGDADQSGAALPIGRQTPRPPTSGSDPEEDGGFVLADLDGGDEGSHSPPSNLPEESVLAGVNEPSEAGISVLPQQKPGKKQQGKKQQPPTRPKPPGGASAVIVDESLNRPPPTPAARGNEESGRSGETTETEIPTGRTAAASKPAGGARRTILAGLAVLLVAATAAVAAVATGVLPADQLPFEIPGDLAVMSGSETTQPTPVAAEGEPEPSEAPAADAATGEAIGAASATVAEAATAPETLDGWLARVGDAPSPARLALLEAWYEGQGDPASGRALMDALREAGRPADARRIAHAVMDDVPAQEKAFYAEAARKISADEFAASQPVEITGDASFEGLAGVDEQRRPGLRLKKSDGSTWVFVPDRGDGEWQAEVALYRLCALIACNFGVPQTQPALLDRATYDALLAGADAAVQEPARKTMNQADWKTLPERNEGREVVWGALRAAVDDHVAYPIEITGTWREWLNAAGSAEVLDTPLEDALEGLKDSAGGAFYDDLMAQRAEATTASMARQLSDVLLIDYLTNDWTRFQGAASSYGKKLRFADGRIVSVDNSAAFQTRASTRIKGRFSWTTRFNREVVDALRALEEEEAFGALLFPVKTRADGARLSVFWDQRRRALKRIDTLVERHGEEAVYGLTR